MTKDNLLNKIKRNILKLIFCNQRTFVIDNMRFTNGRPVTVKNAMIAENKNLILKLQIYRHRLKHNDVIDEAEILQLLKDRGALCQPIIHSTGRDFFKRPYIIMEKVKNKTGLKVTDILLAILEQHKFGIFHGDTKTDNVIFNGLIAKIIDYDQSQILEEIKDLNPKLSAMFFINRLAHFWKEEDKLLNLGHSTEEVTKNCMGYFIGEAFDFSKTSLYESFKPKPYYLLDETYMKSSGENDIRTWQAALNEIDFKEHEKVLDVNPDTGALSRYLCTKNCDVTAYSTHKKEIYATKITSNILGYNLKITDKILDAGAEFDSVFILNNREEINYLKFKGAKRIILSQNKVDYCDLSYSYFDNCDYDIVKEVELDETSDLIILEKKH